MQDASHGALTVANCLPRLQISLPLLCKVPAFLKGGDCSLWQGQSAHRTPKCRQLWWVPGVPITSVCVSRTFLTPSQGSTGSQQPAAPVWYPSCGSCIPGSTFCSVEWRSCTTGKCPGSRGALLKPGLKALVTPRARMNWTVLPEHHFLHPRRFIEAPHESPSLTEHPPPRQRCPPHLFLC